MAADIDGATAEGVPLTPDFERYPMQPGVRDAAVEAAGKILHVTWTDGHEARFHAIWLRDNAPDSENLNPEPPSFDVAAILEDDEVLAEWLTAVARYGVARLTAVAPEEGMVGRVVERIGPVRPTTFGRLFHVKVNPGSGPGSNAYTTLGLSPHTDLPTREYQPGLQFLHCLANSASGGAGVMVDGYAVAEAIRKADPAAYRTLTTVALPHSNRAEDSDYRWRSPVFRLNDRGAVHEVRAGAWVGAPLDLPFDQVEEAYHALRVFFATARESRYAARVIYRPGDLIAMDNRRLLHGRDAYDQGAGERWLQGCYGEREELYSRLRVLARR